MAALAKNDVRSRNDDGGKHGAATGVTRIHGAAA